MTRKNISSGAKWEDIVGYSRAVKVGNIIEIAGTAAVKEGKVVAVGDAYTQTKFIIEKIEKTLVYDGANLNDVIRNRMFVKDINRWE